MILEAKNVSYYYKSQRDKLILDHVSYGFECGKLYAILGPSGSGKTTLLSLLAMGAVFGWLFTLIPTLGSVWINAIAAPIVQFVFLDLLISTPQKKK